MKKLLHWLRGCKSSHFKAKEICFGVLDVTYECICGKKWIRTFRANTPDVALWYSSLAARSEK